MFQDYLLFPNLTALENVAFGLRARGIAKADARTSAALARARRARRPRPPPAPRPLRRPSATRRASPAPWPPNPACCCSTNHSPPSTPAPVETSAGTCAATSPRSTVSASSSPTTPSTPTPSPTASPSSTRPVVQTGTFDDVTAHPRSRYVADLVGVNLLAGTGHQRHDHHHHRRPVIPADHVDGPASRRHPTPQRRPLPHTTRRQPPQRMACTVADVDRQADRVRVRLHGEVPLVAEITPAALDALALQPGDHIWATVKATEITTYPA